MVYDHNKWKFALMAPFLKLPTSKMDEKHRSGPPWYYFLLLLASSRMKDPFTPQESAVTANNWVLRLWSRIMCVEESGQKKVIAHFTSFFILLAK